MSKKNLVKESIFKLLIVLTIVTTSSCLNEKKNNTTNFHDKFVNTAWRKLEGENIKLKLPNHFKLSSRYRLKEDMPLLSQDTAQLYLVQKSLELLEFEDSLIDIYVDTTKLFRMIFICNTQRIDFNKSDIGILKYQTELNNKKYADQNYELEFGEVSANLRGKGNLKLARLTTPITKIADNSTLFNSIFYVTGSTFSLVVYEFSNDEEFIETYLLTARLN